MTKQTNFPAEWAKQAAILITWPHIESAWHYMLDKVEATYLALAKAVAETQPLVIQLHASIKPEQFLTLLKDNDINIENCFFAKVDSNDTWARDHGPVSVTNAGKPALLNFHFNGWGGKFAFDKDNLLNASMAEAGLLPSLSDIDFILEGGSLETDGLGTLLTTEQCLLNENRNPEFDKAAIEKLLSESLGVDHFLWLQNGHLEGDDTDAHIDTLVRFCDENTLLFQGCQDEADSHFQPLSAMKAELEQLRKPSGEPYKIVELPLPKGIYAEDGHRLPATYANFLITNKLVVVPTYADESDSAALAIIAELFPERKVVGVDARPLIEEHGSIHCITMQLLDGTIDLAERFKLASA
ncbi:agmatine deiminase family protein [Reinekea marinisedimentorum]|uniref:Agmatine deiminase n=1 Tax=Reinekea marinisedimentorum TaxID=230495 RepID=A0A4R3IAM9_9GAMM|nr:agmatine deiminase family protein [Reinekea marinisedimentorum]TCS42577.1 agmatine deiminase [Reinekea marinisedimentorum]